jgi:hypothetical protein
MLSDPLQSARILPVMRFDRWPLAVGSSRFTVHGSRFAVGGWRLPVGGWRLAVGGWQIAIWPFDILGILHFRHLAFGI